MSGPTDPTDLSIPSFERVSDIDFDECDRHPLKVVRVVPIEDNDDGFDW